jgi:DNA-binding GntR family transcriptional regulator
MGQASSRSNRSVVYETLRRKVLTLELPPGASLSENELAASLGVSRTPVRESLILLGEEGLVRVFPKVGSFRDAQFLREAVELAAFDDIPETLDPELVAELRANLEQQREPGLDLETFFALDEAFHHGLLRLSGHGRAWSTVVAAKGHLDRARRLGLHETNDVGRFVDEHHAILDAVVAGDISSARDSLRAHLRAVFDDIEKTRRRSPELFAADDGSVPVRRSVAVWE